MWTLFYRRPRLLGLSILMIAATGLAAYSLLPRSEDPRQKNRYSFIITSWPGASAERVEALVTEPVEQELLRLEKIRRFRSTSSAGMSVIQLELAESVSDVDAAWAKIRHRMAELAPALPDGCAEPYVADTEEADAYTLISAITWEGEGDAPYGILTRLARELESRFRFLPGTEYTRLFGAPREEILVEAPGHVMAELGLTTAELSRIIDESDPKLAAGRVWGRTNQLHIEIAGELDSLQRIAEIPLRHGASGQVIRLGDIASVRRTTEDPPHELAFLDGKPGVAVAVRMEPGRRVDRWAAHARETLAGFAGEISEGIKVDLIFDQSEYVQVSLVRLLRNLILGMLCVIGVTLLMMGWRSAILVGIVLPLNVALVLGGMLLAGVTIHQVSITGLVLSLGLLIDNAIIVIDEMRRRFRSGLGDEEAIEKAARHLFVPLLGSTLTTVLAFSPLLLLSGGIGDFLGPLGITVVLSLVSSFAVSLMLVPALSAYLLRRGLSDRPKGWWRTGLVHTRLTAGYRKVLDTVLHRPALGVGLPLILPLLGFLMAGTLQEQFFPPSERDQFRVQLKMPPQTPIARTAALAREMEAVIRRHGEVERVDTFVGSHIPRFFYNVLSWERQQPNIASAIVRVSSPEAVLPLVHALQQELDHALAEAQVLVLQLEQGPPYKAPIEVRVEGPDLDVLHALGMQLRSVLAATPDVIQTDMSLSTGRPKIALEIDDAEAELAGLQRSGIARALAASLDGSVGGSIVETTEELPVRVRILDAERSNLDQIYSLEIFPEWGGAQRAAVPLSSVGEFVLLPEFSVISHNDNVRDNEVYGYLKAGVPPAPVLADVKKRIEASGIDLPEGYTLAFGGEEETRDEALAMLIAGVPLLLIAMGATLVLSFNSFRLAGLIALVGLLSVGCALAAIWFMDYPLGFMAIVGTMGLVGIAINDSIVVLAAIREHEGARTGDPVAVRKIVMRSTRHVLTTTVTTAAGFTPLFLGGGLFWPPLAVSIAGGVLGATLLALVFVPASYVVLLGRGRALTRLRSGLPIYQAAKPLTPEAAAGRLLPDSKTSTSA